MQKIKKQKSFESSYRPVVIWLEDLAELFAVMKENAEEVGVTTDDYRFETIEELKEHFGSQTQFQLRIDSSQRFAYIEFTRMWVKVYVSPGLHSAQLFHEIDGVLTRCQRKFAFLYSYWLLVPILLSSFATRFVEGQTATILSSVQAVISVWYLWVMFVFLRRSAVIRLQRRSEMRPFLERNKDQLLLLLIGALVGGVIALGVPMLKERFYPSATVNAPKQP